MKTNTFKRQSLDRPFQERPDTGYLSSAHPLSIESKHDELEQSASIASAESLNNSFNDHHTRQAPVSLHKSIFALEAVQLFNQNHSHEKANQSQHKPKKILESSQVGKIIENAGDGSNNAVPGANSHVQGQHSKMLDHDSLVCDDSYEADRIEKLHSHSNVHPTQGKEVKTENSVKATSQILCSKKTHKQKNIFKKGLQQLSKTVKGRRKSEKLDVLVVTPPETRRRPSLEKNLSHDADIFKTERGHKEDELMIDSLKSKNVDLNRIISQPDQEDKSTGLRIEDALRQKMLSQSRNSDSYIAFNTNTNTNANLYVEGQTKQSIDSSRAPTTRFLADRRANVRHQILQPDVVQRAVELSDSKGLTLRLFLLTIYIVFSFISTAIISSLTTYSFSQMEINIWIGYFFHGVFISILAASFLFGIIGVSEDQLKALEEKNNLIKEEERKKSHHVDVYIFAGFISILAGLLLILLSNFAFDPLDGALKVAASEIIVFVSTAILLSIYFLLKNHWLRKKANGEKRKGFFFIPVYKDFMTDLYNTKQTFKEQTQISSPCAQSLKDGKIVIREEGIDKYKPVHLFEILTASRVFGSQLLLIIAYTQFVIILAIVQLCKLCQDKDTVIGIITVVACYPVVMYYFSKVIEVLNKKFQLGLDIHVRYLTSAFTAMFYRLILFHMAEMRYIWIIIGCKTFYKVIVYVIYGNLMRYWNLTFTAKIKNMFSSKASKESEAAFRRRSFQQSGRHDTIMVQQLSMRKKAVDKNQQRINSLTRDLASRFVFTSANDIFFGCGSLIALLFYKILASDFSLEMFLNQTIYIQGTWIELVFDGAILILILIWWSQNRTFKIVPVNQAVKEFFRRYAIHFLTANLALITILLWLIKVLN